MAWMVIALGILTPRHNKWVCVSLSSLGDVDALWLSSLIPGEKILDVDLSIVFRSNSTTPRVLWSKMKSAFDQDHAAPCWVSVVDEVISHLRVH